MLRDHVKAMAMHAAMKSRCLLARPGRFTLKSQGNVSGRAIWHLLNYVTVKVKKQNSEWKSEFYEWQ